MANLGRNFLLFIAFLALYIALCCQVEAQKAHLIAERDIGNGARSQEVVDRIESQLLGALELLQGYQGEAVPPIQAKFAEKRKNKFEFIRFGRKR